MQSNPIQRPPIAADRTSGPAAAPVRPAVPDAKPELKPELQLEDAPKSLINLASIGFLLAAIVLALGYYIPTQRYIVPNRGIGYALGIIGGSLMLSLALYPLRKRLPAIGFLGSVKGWFQAHMILGIVGPILILYHSNFSFGAPNSNAALFAMLIVSGSGIFGRYFYTRIHFGLYGRRATRVEMQAAADELRTKVSGSRFVPDLLVMLDQADERLLAWRSGKALLLIRPLFVTLRMYFERWRITRRAVAELRDAAKQSPLLSQQQAQFSLAVRRYIAKRLQTTRKVAEFESYEALFSLWHMLHLPMFFVLIVAGIVHVVAVHMY
jgi:hypothetical protein